MGVLHFAKPTTVESIVPPQLPGSARLYNYGSGIAEILIGVALLPRRSAATAARAAKLLLLAVWPANFYHAYLDLVNPGEGKRSAGKWIYHLLRQPAQVALMKATDKIARAHRS
ncbi:hypothetical protein ACFPVT_01505 [Corynebacterium choanae]|nr:hypothetical protein [Corynebacterium choanae]